VIVGVGIDVCSIERVEGILSRTGERFLARILSPRERESIAGRKDLATAVAARFAAKEAYSKCLDGARGVPWHSVEILNAPSGRPELLLHGEALDRVHAFGGNYWHISMSHDAKIAIATVIVELRPAKEP
jgi:holo-[acyl-carrier protein] synthase